jgi:hypothetical protein
MPAMTRFPIIACACFALAACGGNDTPDGGDGDEQRNARGEVLGGSITDDMLPLDTVTSQSPPQADEQARPSDADAEQSADTPPAQSEADAEEPEPEPEAAAAEESE